MDFFGDIGMGAAMLFGYHHPEPFAAVFDIPERKLHVACDLPFHELKEFLADITPWAYEIIEEDVEKKQLVILKHEKDIQKFECCFFSIKQVREGRYQLAIHKRYKYTPPLPVFFDVFVSWFENR